MLAARRAAKTRPALAPAGRERGGFGRLSSAVGVFVVRQLQVKF